jgi:hypothetical protein
MADIGVKTRDQWLSMMQRNASNYSGGDMDVGPDSAPYILFATLADALAMESQNDLAIARSAAIANMDDAQTEAAYGETVPRNLESHSSGFVTIQAAPTGATIEVGDELSDPASKTRVVVNIAAATLYLNGAQVPVVSVDPGLGVNIAAGVTLTWSTLRSGCYAPAIVFAQPDGGGIVEGRDKESLDEWHERIRAHNANPAGHGNEGDILTLIEDVSGRQLPNGRTTMGHGVPVEKGFVYPALEGCGTCGMTFTIKRDNWFQSREPSAGNLSTVYAYVAASLPGDFSLLPIDTNDALVSVDLIVSLNGTAAQWADFSPWPASSTRSTGRKIIDSAYSNTAIKFRIKTYDGDYTGETNPVTGQTVGVLDYANGVMVKKRILTVTGTGPWVIDVDTSANASDTTYVPLSNQAVSPWFDAIQSVAESLGKSVAKMGVGECAINPPGDGVRQVRVPVNSPLDWPEDITARIAYDVVGTVPSVVGATFLSASPSSVPYTSPDQTSILRLWDVGIYKA